MPRKAKIRSLTIIGRRWFRGTTDCSAVILINGREVASLPQANGPDNHYERRAYVWLRDNGWLPEKYCARSSSGAPTYAMHQIVEDLKIAFYSVAIDVAREKDL